MDEYFEERRSDRGFTLIELIVVLVILGMLAAVVAPRIYDKLSTSKDQIAKIDIAGFEGALQIYAFDMGRLPDTSEGLDALVRNPFGNESWNGPYLKKDISKDPWQRDYVYRYPGTHGEFDLFSLGADGAEGTEDDICNWK